MILLISCWTVFICLSPFNPFTLIVFISHSETKRNLTVIGSPSPWKDRTHLLNWLMNPYPWIEFSPLQRVVFQGAEFDRLIVSEINSYVNIVSNSSPLWGA
jgi:hypothetical protein